MIIITSINFNNFSFFFLQCDYFHSTVLKIEGDNVSAVDVVHQLDVLRGNFLLRKTEKYLHPDTEAELMELTSVTGQFEREIIEGYFSEFFGNIIKFVNENQSIK